MKNDIYTHTYLHTNETEAMKQTILILPIRQELPDLQESLLCHGQTLARQISGTFEDRKIGQLSGLVIAWSVYVFNCFYVCSIPKKKISKLI